VATIQIRDIPEDRYETLRRRARRCGQSLQAYMHDQVVALADRPTKEEAVEVIEDVLAGLPPGDPTPESIVADLHAERR
jgi:hypothetical protein